jgi:NRE family putative nickel resistance protein-like MFS transporter
MSQVFTSGGESLTQIAMPLLVYHLTESSRMVGLMALLIILPRVVLAPITGMLADRINRRQILIAANLLRFILVCLVPLTTTMWQLGVLAILLAVGNAAGRPAELASVPVLAGPHRLVAALSLIQVSNSIIRIAAPAAGAAVIAVLGPSPVFWVIALCFALALVPLRKLVIPQGDRPAVETTSMFEAARRELWAGLRAIRDIPVVRGVTASESVFQVAMAAMTVAGIVYTQEALHLEDRAEAAFALMTTFLAAGAVVGALMANRIELRLGRPLMMAIGYLGPFFLIVAVVSPPMPIIYAAWFCFGFMDALAVISFQAYLAEAVPEYLRGRVYAAWGAVVALASAITFYAMGFVTEWIGAPIALGVAGLIVGIGAPLSLWLSGAVRSVRTGPEPVVLSSVDRNVGQS